MFISLFQMLKSSFSTQYKIKNSTLTSLTNILRKSTSPRGQQKLKSHKSVNLSKNRSRRSRVKLR